MTRVKLEEILKAISDRLNGDQNLKSICPSIFNHVPQEHALPLIRFRHTYASEWDTKDSFGFESSIMIDIWTDYRGDKLSAEISDIIIALFDMNPLILASGQSLYIRHDLSDFITEGDGLTHHSVLRFRQISTT